jgi:hypothetical protein
VRLTRTVISNGAHQEIEFRNPDPGAMPCGPADEGDSTAATRWLISWAIAAASSPIVVTRLPCPSSVCASRIASETSITRMTGAVLLEQNDERLRQRRYMQIEGMAELAPPTIDIEPAKLPPKAA